METYRVRFEPIDGENNSNYASFVATKSQVNFLGLACNADRYIFLSTEGALQSLKLKHYEIHVFETDEPLDEITIKVVEKVKEKKPDGSVYLRLLPFDWEKDPKLKEKFSPYY